MEVRVKKRNNDGLVRLESSGIVKEIMVNEDFLHPQKQTISVCFAGKNSSGIMDLNMKKVEMIMKALAERNHLIKGVKIFKE